MCTISVVDVVGNDTSEQPLSVTISCAGKRGTYEGKYVATERSGLIDNSSVCFLVDIFHQHGYDANMNPFWGKQVKLNLVREGDFVFDKRSKNLQRGKKVSSIKKLNNVGKFFNKPNCFRKSVAIVPIRYATRESDVMLKELVHTTFYHGNTVLCHQMNEITDSDAEEVPTNTIKSDTNTSPELQKKIAEVGKLDCGTIMSLTKDCKKPITLQGVYNGNLIDAIVTAFKKVYTTPSFSEHNLQSLILLTTTFLHELLSDDSSCSESELTSSALTSGTESNVADITLNESNDPMADLLSSAFRDESSVVNMRDLLRDIGSDHDRQRNILLALMAGSQGRSNRREGVSSSEQRLLRTLQGENDSDDVRFGRTQRSSTRSFNLSNQRNNKDRPKQAFTSKLRRPSPELSTNAATRSLINDGVLVDSLEWVERALRNGADCEGRDEEGISILQLAISMGCQLPIIRTLVDRGASVSKGELGCAAQTNQKRILEFLLRHTLYEDGSIRTTHCSKEVLDTLASASERQRSQRTKMKNDAAHFASQLVSGMIMLALNYHRNGSIHNCRLLTNALIGDVLLRLVVKNQGSRIKTMSTESNDIRNPIHSSSATITSSTLFDMIPSKTFSSLLRNDDVLLGNYSLLVEAFLWSKQLPDIAVGLTLVCKLIEVAPDLCVGVGRFGFKELAVEHISRAELHLSELLSSESIDEVLNIKCPKLHIAIIHLTKHSQFRCDLCGKGVKQGKIFT